MGLIRKQRIAWRLDDRVRGREATVVDIIEEPADDPELPAVTLRIINDVEVHKAWRKFFKYLAVRKPEWFAREIGPYPSKAVEICPMNDPDPAVPSTKVIIHEDQRGRAPYDEKTRGSSYDQSIAELQKEKQRLQNELELKDLDQDDSSRSRSTSSNGSNDGGLSSELDELGGLE